MRTGNVVGEAIAGLDLDLTAILLEIRNPVGLEQDLNVRVFAGVACRGGVSDSMLACLDLTQFQFRYGGVVDPRLQRRGLERIDSELAAEIGQRI